MKTAPFEYHAPNSIDEVLSILREHADEAKVLAGGQSLVPLLALRLTRFAHLVDLNRVSGLDEITSGSDSLSIGTMVRQTAAGNSLAIKAQAPLISRAIPLIGHFQIRNRGTVGGSIAHGDPASELPAVASVLGAQIEVQSHRGTRHVPASEFYLGTWETDLAPDEIIVAVRFPPWGQRSGFAIEELAWRTGDFAIAGVACGVELDQSGLVRRCEIAFMGMGPTTIRPVSVVAAVLGTTPDEIDLTALGVEAVATTSPPSDIHASANYRTKVAVTLFESALKSAFQEAARA